MLCVTRVTVDPRGSPRVSSAAERGGGYREVFLFVCAGYYTYIHVRQWFSVCSEFIPPKGYVGIVLSMEIGATMAGYSSALNTDFAPESARRMRRSAIDAIGDAVESAGCAITR